MMNSAVQMITWQGLVLAFIPAVIAIAIMFRWAAGGGAAIYATTRMLLQLLLIGFVLVYIFETDSPWIIATVLLVMLVAASWIAIRPVQRKQPSVYRNALVAITVSGVLTLVLVSQVVIKVEPWFSPRYIVPLAGMIFAGAMNTVSLAAERFHSESERGASYFEARRVALETALIPMINSLFAVGLVSLPGMMTGQILSGVSPFVAAKYQIVVMTMLFGVSGVSAALFVVLEQRSITAAKDAQ